ncbi:adrenocorticotropic hormone receptor-like [Patiria miniata]|uniref:G-protein coupled receptors family 1 profile domain-containing protein n=1 Tax=Patiria miniata TaxID=46514 RepID=A0A914A080_PATMI|nr:adrenocorticotropic hormone receptor-like [Patiria miniata]
METTWPPNKGIIVTSNSTENNIENEHTSTTLVILVAVLAVLAVFLCVLLNPLMLFTLRRVTSIQPTTKIFMASLTLSDLCNNLYWILVLTELFAGSWLLGDFLCVVYGVTSYLFVSLSIFSLFILTVDRYIAISQPLQYPSIMTVFRSKIIVFSSWAAVSIFCILIFGIDGSRIVSLDTRYYLCIGHYDWRNYLAVLLAVVIILSIFILYARIALIARKQARRISAENQAGNGQGGQRINTRSTTTIIIITGTLIITWIPTVVRLLIVIPSPQHTWTQYLAGTFTNVLLLCNGWLNVMIYYLRNRDLRQAVRALLSDWHQSLQQRFLH